MRVAMWLDPHLERSRVWWMEHLSAYRATRDWYEEHKELQILKQMSKSGAQPIPRIRKK